MDASKHLHGRTGATVPEDGSKTNEIRSCAYCKAKFEVGPLSRHKRFCKDTCRKLAHRYGSMAVGKIAEKTIRDVRKMFESELAPLRARVETLQDRVGALEIAAMNPGLNYIRLRERVEEKRAADSERTT